MTMGVLILVVVLVWLGVLLLIPWFPRLSSGWRGNSTEVVLITAVFWPFIIPIVLLMLYLEMATGRKFD